MEAVGPGGAQFGGIGAGVCARPSGGSTTFAISTDERPHPKKFSESPQYAGHGEMDLEDPAPGRAAYEDDAETQHASIMKMSAPPQDCYVFEAYPEVKKAFIRRVYTILLLQILLTTSVLYAVRWFYNIDGFSSPAEGGGRVSGGPSDAGAVEPPHEMLHNMFWSGFLGSMISLMVLRFVAKQHPHNLIALFTFTFFESLLLTSALVTVPGELLARALFTTAAVFAGLILYTLKTAKTTDYSFLGSYLCSALWILIVATFTHSLWPMGDFVDSVLTWGGALLFCGFITVDIWRLHFKLKPDEYVIAAVELYLDFINLFIRILHLLSKKK